MFVTAIEARKHKCPAKIHSVDDLRPAPPPVLQPPLNRVFDSLEGWAIYTDGSGPAHDAQHAGWGVAVWSFPLDSALPDFELFGPVPLEKWDNRWIGVEVATNNVAELTALAEAFLWLENEAPGPPSYPATLHFDSTYAQQIITEQSEPTTNIELVKQARCIYRRVSTQRLISWNKVVAHSNNHGNEYADFLAGEGSKGHQTKQSQRWHLPVGSPAPCDPLLTDWCWRRGTVYSGPSYARQLAGHEAYCKVPGAPPPSLPRRKNCGVSFPWQFPKGKRKQAHHAREFRKKHEKNCRGSPELTRTCPHCNLVLPLSTTDDMIISHLKKLLSECEQSRQDVEAPQVQLTYR